MPKQWRRPAVAHEASTCPAPGTIAANMRAAPAHSLSWAVRPQLSVHEGSVDSGEDTPGTTRSNQYCNRVTDRTPALQRLLADIRAGQVDCVLTHRVDRLSRSLLDFAKLMELFDQRQVAFVSVTQHFNSGTSMGRLVLNVLLSFAQFERELIAERTRDKVAAARRKGKWSGGLPILGYDVDARTKKLVINEEEAVRVRAIFVLYLEHRGLLPVVEEMARRGWCNKQSLTRQGRVRGGRPFTKGSLYQLLTNVTSSGQVRYHQEIHPGEQPAIVDPQVWQDVQALLAHHGHTRHSAARSPSKALLQGLLRCRPCDCAMTPAHVTNGNRRYRYYTCSAAQKKGWHTCPSRSLPAMGIERLVLEQVASEVTNLAMGSVAWQTLPPAELARRLREIVARIEYDGTSGRVAITLRSSTPQARTGRTTSPAVEEMP